MRASLLIWGMMLLLFACEKKVDVIPQDKMVDILVDIHLTDGIITSNVEQFSYNEEKFPAYQKIYQKYGIDEAIFDSSLYYYSKEIKLFVQIYDSVITKLMKIETDVQTGKYFQPDLIAVDTLVSNSFRQDSLLLDSIFRELWNLERSFSLPEYTERGKIDFKIKIDTAHGFEYRLYSDIMLYPGDSSENPHLKMELEYRDSTTSKITMPLVKDSSFHAYALVLKIDSGKTPKLLKGRLLDDDKCLGDKSAEVKNVRVYEIGEPALADSLRYKGLIHLKE